MAVDLNVAGPEQLAHALGRDRAEYFVQLRSLRGPFTRWEEIRALPGITEADVEALRRIGTLGEDQALQQK